MTKLLFKQRFFSWLDSYDIYDKEGNTMFVVKGVLALGHCLHIFDAKENHVGTIKEEFFTLLPRFRMYVGDQYVGQIKKEFTLLRPAFHLDFNNWVVKGDYLSWNYEVEDSGRMVMSAAKRIWNLTDTYEITVMQEQDVLYSLMIVLAIDAAKCSSNA